MTSATFRLIRDLRNKNIHKATEAARRLREEKTPLAVEPLIEALRNTLQKIEKKDINAWEEKEELIFRAAVEVTLEYYALQEVGNVVKIVKALVDAYIAECNPRSKNVILSALSLLKREKALKAVDFFLEKIREYEEELKGQKFPSAWKDRLIQDAFTGLSLLEILLRDTSAAKPLCEMLKSPNPFMRAHTAFTLNSIAAPECERALKEALEKEKDPYAKSFIQTAVQTLHVSVMDKESTYRMLVGRLYPYLKEFRKLKRR